MDLKGAFYTGAALAWWVIVIGAWIAVDLGHTEPWLSFSDIPGGSTGGMAGAIAVAFVGWKVISTFNERHERAEWKEAGRHAGLRPSDTSVNMDDPELTGTVDGRTVTASYDKRKMEGSGDSDGRWVTFTRAETELAGAADEGVVVGSAGGSVDAGVGTLDFDEMAETASGTEGIVAVETGDLVLVGTSTAAVEAVAEGLSGEAIRAIRDLTIVSCGDASGVVAGWAEARNEELAAAGSSLFEYPVDNFVERIPGDAATVTVETKTSIRDGDDLQRFAQGVVAIADAFEEATAPPRTSG